MIVLLTLLERHCDNVQAIAREWRKRKFNQKPRRFALSLIEQFVSAWQLREDTHPSPLNY
jgi:hypothetical protein